MIDQIKQMLLAENDGWGSLDKALFLFGAALTSSHDSLEVGVYTGRSAIPVALAHKLRGGQLVAVDPWSNDAATEGYEGANKQFWSALDLESIYQKFNRWIERFALGEHCRVIRSRSDDYKTSELFGLINLDGQHGEPTLRDINHFAPNLARGGLMVIDDLNWPDMQSVGDLVAAHQLTPLFVHKDTSEWGVYRKA